MTRLFETFGILKPDLRVDTRVVGPDFYEALDRDYADFRGHVLVSAHRFDADWPTWEVHPDGDECVVLVDGAADMVLRGIDGDTRVPLTQPGDFVVVPAGTWHTARIATATSMIFFTPGAGTVNAETPPVP